MEKLQKQILEFDQARNWDNSWNIKDLCLNINEEIGELWHLIKWVDEKTQRQIIKDNYDEAENFVGDMLFLIYKIANQMNVDAEKALVDVLTEYEKRMPADIMKEKGHANKNAGGYDKKDDN